MAHQQISLFGPTPVPLAPQWGGHGGNGPVLHRLNRVLRLAASGGLDQPDWWKPYATQSMGQSSLFWAIACKLVQVVEDGSQRFYRPSPRGQMLLQDDPYFESLSSSAAASPLLWVLHWWLVSRPCLSRGVEWLWASSQPERTTRLEMEQRLRSWAIGEASQSALKAELKMLLDAYLPCPTAEEETTLEHGFWELDLLRYDPESLNSLLRQMYPKTYAKQESMARKGQRTGSLPEPPRPTAAMLAQTQIVIQQVRQGAKTAVPDLALLYASLDYLVSQGQNKPAGTVALSHLLWKDWHCPGTVLRFKTGALEAALERLNQRRLAIGLSLNYLPDQDGEVLVWSRPLKEIQKEIWVAMIG